MKFNDFIEVGAIKADLAAEGKEGAIEELVGCLVAAGGIQADEQKSIVDAVMKREELGSTGDWPRRRGTAYEASQCRPLDRYRGNKSRRRRFQQPGWRKGSNLLPAGIASGPTRRSLARFGEHIPPTAG